MAGTGCWQGYLLVPAGGHLCHPTYNHTVQRFQGGPYMPKDCQAEFCLILLVTWVAGDCGPQTFLNFHSDNAAAAWTGWLGMKY